MKTCIAMGYRRFSYVTDLAGVDRLESLGEVFRAREAIEAGVYWRDLYRARDAGLVLELSRGLYQLSDSPALDQLDFVVACARSPKGMVCLGSALAYWELSDQIPASVDLAVPSGAHRPRIGHPPVRIHVFRADLFDLGQVRVEVGRDAGFVITDRERTVVDAFRMRHELGEDIAIGALRRYLRRPRSKPGRVLELADALRVRTPVAEALRVLQE